MGWHALRRARGAVLSRNRGGSRGTLAAAPNPVPGGLGLATTVVTWATGDGSPGQVYVSDDGGPEKLFAAGSHGSAPAAWIEHGKVYTFTLFAGADRRDRLAELPVTRADVPWAEIRADLARYAGDDAYKREVAHAIAPALPHYVYGENRGANFRLFEEHGIHVTPVHFYQPIPDSRALSDDLWRARSELVGVDLRTERQLELVRDVFPRFREEYEAFPFEPTGRPHEFYFDNPQFTGTDALVLYCMVRHLRPRLIVEVGSGFSTRVSAKAALANGDTRVVSVEPFHDGTERHEALRRGFPGLTSVVTERVEDLDLSFFDDLEAGDVLFIDTSHVARVGGDVVFLFLEVLPRLKPGVVVHVHDVFLPFEYPREWVFERLRFYNEQYLVQAFLAFNRDFEVLLANHYLGRVHRTVLEETFPRSPWWVGSSFWMRRAESGRRQ